MTLRIEYKYEASSSWPFKAFAYHEGTFLSTGSSNKSFDEAKTEAIVKAQQAMMNIHQPPANEVIEI